MSDTSNTSATKATRVQNICNTSATRTTRVQHDCDRNGTIATRVKKIDFDNNTSENIFCFLKRLILFLSKEFIILDFANFHQKIKPWVRIMQSSQQGT